VPVRPLQTACSSPKSASMHLHSRGATLTRWVVVGGGRGGVTLAVSAAVTPFLLPLQVVLVREKYIALAMLRLIEMEKAVVEGGGAAGLAAFMQGLLPELKVRG
jgi:hypothetical protein